MENFNHQAKVGSPTKADQLIIVLEPEAAAIFCQEMNLNEFQTETGANQWKAYLLNQTNIIWLLILEVRGTLRQKKLKQTLKKTPYLGSVY